MNNYWLYDTRGDPLGAVQELIGQVWEQAGLQGVLAPYSSPNGGDAGPESMLRYLEDPEQVWQINIFRPGMSINAARLLPGLLNDHPGQRLGAVLRPCEMRALAAVAERTPLPLDRLVTICVDCLATFPADDLSWRSDRRIPAEDITQDTLRFARQGGVAAYRYRSACQMCSSQAAEAADINVGVLGLPVRRNLLVLTQRELAPGRQLDPFYTGTAFPAGPAPQQLIDQRERVLARQSERHDRTRERLKVGLAHVLPRTVQELADQLESCGGCQDCMDACPICSAAPLQRQTDGSYDVQELTCWLLSCAGCGMCEQACSHHLPLTSIFSKLRKELVM
jgi:formate dehydrogenase (coenzyme F420) beta subunit